MVTEAEALAAVRDYLHFGETTKAEASAMVNQYYFDSIPGVSLNIKQALSAGGVEWVTVTATFPDGRTSEYQAELNYINRSEGGVNYWIVQCVNNDPKYEKYKVIPATPTALPKGKYALPTGLLLPIAAIVLLIMFLIRSVKK